MKKYIDSPMCNAQLNRGMWELYLRNGDGGIPEYAAPMLAHDFSDLPPAHVEVEEFDCLHDEGITYAQALRQIFMAKEVDIATSFLYDAKVELTTFFIPYRRVRHDPAV